MKNKYEVRGEVAVIFIKRRNGQIIETLIDTEDLEKVKRYPYSWVVKDDKHTRSFYVTSLKIKEDGKRTSIKLHRLILDEPEGMVIDHINHDTLDNRKENLRVITNEQNQQNKKGARKNSKSGIRGVSYARDMNKWRVGVHFNGKRHHFGYFEDLKEAEKVAIEARKKYMPYSLN